jgi:hypothetical protein
MMWEFIFLMVVLKIPIIYLCLVVYWAVRGNDRPLEPAPVPAPPDDGNPWRPRSRRPRNGPHGSPTRLYARVRRRRTAAPVG